MPVRDAAQPDQRHRARTAVEVGDVDGAPVHRHPLVAPPADRVLGTQRPLGQAGVEVQVRERLQPARAGRPGAPGSRSTSAPCRRSSSAAQPARTTPEAYPGRAPRPRVWLAPSTLKELSVKSSDGSSSAGRSLGRARRAQLSAAGRPATTPPGGSARRAGGWRSSRAGVGGGRRAPPAEAAGRGAARSDAAVGVAGDDCRLVPGHRAGHRRRPGRVEVGDQVGDRERRPARGRPRWSAPRAAPGSTSLGKGTSPGRRPAAATSRSHGPRWSVADAGARTAAARWPAQPRGIRSGSTVTSAMIIGWSEVFRVSGPQASK